MAKNRDDEIYEHGVRDGQSGGLFDDFCQRVSKGIGGRESDIYDKGYEFGARHRNDRDEDDDDSSSDDSGCFLTTACVEHAQLGDDCAELRSMRQFRDDFVRRLPEGATILADYYASAPRIVASIRARPDASLILDGMLAEVRVATRMIEEGRGHDALAYCKERLRF